MDRAAGEHDLAAAELHHGLDAIPFR